MKIKILLLFSIQCLAILIIFGSCASSQNPDDLVLERFCGTWANQEYEDRSRAKYIINPDETLVWYTSVARTGPAAVGTYTVEKRWRDADGNSFYHVKVYKLLADLTQFELWRIDKYTSIWEQQYSQNDYPEAIDPKDKHSDYRIYYRY